MSKTKNNTTISHLRGGIMSTGEGIFKDPEKGFVAYQMNWVSVYWQRGTTYDLVGVIHNNDVEAFRKDKVSTKCSTLEEYRDCLRDFVFKKGRGFLKEDYSPKSFPKEVVTKSLIGKTVVIRDCSNNNGRLATVINEDLVGGKLQLRVENGGEYWRYRAQVRVLLEKLDKDIEPICHGMTVRFILNSCDDEKIKSWIKYEIAFGTMKETDPVDVALASKIENAHELRDALYKNADGTKELFSMFMRAIIGDAAIRLRGILFPHFQCEADDSKLLDKMIGIRVTATDGDRKFDRKYFVGFDKVLKLKGEIFVALRREIESDYRYWMSLYPERGNK
jgi:hypothetical protein